MRSCVLMGPPGSGKPTMYVKPALRRPLLVIDADRKLRSLPFVAPLIEKGDILCWELDEALVEEKLSTRLKRFIRNEKPAKEPRGWLKFVEFCEIIETSEEANKAGTIVIDSYTVALAHALRLITYWDDKGTATLSPRNWAGFLTMCQETTTEIIDFCIRKDKDLIITVHEKIGEIPLDSGKVTKRKDVSGMITREYVGDMRVKVVPSIMGQFAYEFGLYVQEFYALSVSVKNGVPTWICRVMPDGNRDLRTSLDTNGETEFEPNFHKIWK